MKDWFEWKGVRSTEYGIYVSEQPPITMPQERATFISVPGRSGSLTKLEGEDVYEDVLLTAKCFMADAERIQEIMSWLKGSGKVTFANRPEGYYKARVINQIPFDKVLRGRENRTFAVCFRCKPFWHVSEEEEITLRKSGSVENEGTVYSEPVITVTGTGDVTLMVGETIVELEGVDGSITIDSEFQETYKGSLSRNGAMSGEYPRLAPGMNQIAWTGSVTSVKIRPNTRYL